MIIGVGIDLVEVARITSLCAKHGDHFLKRIFTEGEAAYCNDKHDPSPHLSARFAAKEAVAKALGTGIMKNGIRFRDIEVCKDQGPPRIELHGGAKSMAESMGVSRIFVSITHERQYAAAVVILEGNG